MNGTSIARMDETPFDFSEETRRIHIKPCDHKACDGYGEFRNFRMHNGLPRLILLCQRHDKEAAKEDGELQGEPITDISTIMELFKILLGGEVAETPQIETAPQEPEESATEESPQEGTPILEFEESKAETEERKPEPTPGVYILEERPSKDHYFCVEEAGVEAPCNKWMHKKDAPYHAKKTHGIEPYQHHLLPREKFECVRGDHIGAGCVMTFPTQGGLSTHLTRTKLKFPAPSPQIPHQAQEQQQPADADHATT